MAAPWVRLLICGRTNAAHRPRAPLPTPTPQRGKIQQGSPAPESCYATCTAVAASAFTSRLILAAPRSTGVQKVSNQGPGTRLRAQGAGQESVHIGCALLAPENEDVSEQKNDFTPNTTNAQKAKKTGQHYPAPVGAGLVPALSCPRRRLPYPPNPSRRGAPCGRPRQYTAPLRGTRAVDVFRVPSRIEKVSPLFASLRGSKRCRRSSRPFADQKRCCSSSRPFASLRG